MEATDFDGRLAERRPRHHRRGPDRRPDRRSARPRSASPGGRPRRASRASRSVAASSPTGSTALAAVGAVAVPVVERPQSVEAAMAAGDRAASSAAASGSPGWRRSGSNRRALGPCCRHEPRQGRPEAPAEAPVLRTRPDLGEAPRALPARASSATSSTSSARYYGRPVWQRRLDPTSELILTILTQNSADTNAEVAFEALRAAYPSDGVVQAHNPGAGWGGVGLPDGVGAGLGGGRARAAPRAGRHDPSGRPGQPEGAADPGDAATASARSAATTRSSSSATCPRSTPATG